MNYARVVSMTVSALVAVALPLEAATATWDRNPEPSVTGYRLSYGTQSGVHPTTIEVGNVVSYEFFPPVGQRYYVVVQARNSSGLSAKSAQVVLDLRSQVPPNQAPVLTQPANQTSVRNTAVSLILVANDPNGTAVTYSASGLPPGLTVNSASGRISGTVTTVGSYNVTARASDGALTSTRTFNWSVTAGTGTVRTVNLLPIDTTLHTQGGNLSSATRLTTHTYPRNKVKKAIVMKFNLSKIPANATIQSATLQLYLVGVDAHPADPNYAVSLHRILHVQPNPNAATGFMAAPNRNWTANACCSFSAPMAQADISAAQGVTTINRTLGAKTWNALSVVRAWLNAPATNYGLLLNADKASAADSFRHFASMEDRTASRRPFLRVTYTVPSGTAAATTALSAPIAGANVAAGIASTNNTSTNNASTDNALTSEASTGDAATNDAPADLEPSLTQPAEDETPVAGDFDGDGRPDLATFRRETGTWQVWPSASDFAAATPVVWGVADDVPVAADYDGDRRTDIAVYRPSTGTWHVLFSSTDMQSGVELQWGDADDRPLALDYDRDGRADLALPRRGGFEILLSGSNYTSSVSVR